MKYLFIFTLIINVGNVVVGFWAGNIASALAWIVSVFWCGSAFMFFLAYKNKPEPFDPEKHVRGVTFNKKDLER